jgi:hypothetical protein
MNNKNNDLHPRRGKGGRSPKDDPAIYRYSVNFTAVQHARYLTLFERSGIRTHARFIAARVFLEEFRVVKTDRAAMEFATRLTEFHAQFRAVGVNYNQVVKELHSHFSEKKTLALLYKLEGLTREFVALNQKIIDLAVKFEHKNES